MKNKGIFVKNVEDCSLIRHEINESHRPILDNLGKLYELLLNRKSSEFKFSKDILYYTGGWPSDNTPPKAKSLATNIADAYTLLSFIGEENDLNYYLGKRGLKISVDENFHKLYLLNKVDYKFKSSKLKKIKDIWEDTFEFGFPEKMPMQQILRFMMDLALATQKNICQLADKIKIESGKHVAAECGVKVKNFTEAVTLKYRENKGRDIDDSVESKELDLLINLETLETLK